MIRRPCRHRPLPPRPTTEDRAVRLVEIFLARQALIIPSATLREFSKVQAHPVCVHKEEILDAIYSTRCQCGPYGRGCGVD